MPTPIPINMGPMQLYLDGDPMPLTQGGVTFNTSITTMASMADVSGDFPRALYITGGEFSIEANFTEVELSDVLDFFPVVSGNVVKLPVGYNLAEDEHDLLLRPLVAGVADTDNANAIFCPRIALVPSFNTEFSTANQRIWTVTFTLLPYDPVANDMSIVVLGAATYTPGT